MASTEGDGERGSAELERGSAEEEEGTEEAEGAEEKLAANVEEEGVVGKGGAAVELGTDGKGCVGGAGGVDSTEG